MNLRLKISHHRHSWHLQPHEYTSYMSLIFLMVMVGIALTIVSVSAQTNPPPQSGSIGLSGIMPGPVPKSAAVIITPSNQQQFSSTPVTVSGTCPAGTLVEIYKNDIFGGSTICSSSGTFSLNVDLLVGSNSLMANVYNALNQPGPDSTPVTTYFNALPAQTSSLAPLNLSSNQLILNTDAVYRGIFPGQQLSIPVDIIGGVPPYAINVQWGDSSNSVVPRNNNVPFNIEHTYSKPGTYQITIQGSDAQGRTAYLTVAAIVNGQPSVLASTSSSSSTPNNELIVLWPLYTSALAMIVSFWLGEKREKRLLSNPGLRLHPQM